MCPWRHSILDCSMPFTFFYIARLKSLTFANSSLWHLYTPIERGKKNIILSKRVLAFKIFLFIVTFLSKWYWEREREYYRIYIYIYINNKKVQLNWYSMNVSIHFTKMCISKYCVIGGINFYLSSTQNSVFSFSFFFSSGFLVFLPNCFCFWIWVSLGFCFWIWPS